MSNNMSVTGLKEEFNNELNKFKKSLELLQEDATKVQDGSYWSGEAAYNSIKDVLTQIDYNNNLLKELDKCNNYIQSLNE